jgi:hypothetical protein
MPEVSRFFGIIIRMFVEGSTPRSFAALLMRSKITFTPWMINAPWALMLRPLPARGGSM